MWHFLVTTKIAALPYPVSVDSAVKSLTTFNNFFNYIYITEQQEMSLSHNHRRLFKNFHWIFQLFWKEISRMKDEAIQKEIDLIQQILNLLQFQNFLNETQEPESNT